MVNGTDSLISPSDFSLLVYRNASDFYTLTMKNQKEKFRNQSHSPVQQKELNI